MTAANHPPITPSAEHLTVQIRTADDCQGTFTVGVVDGERHQTNICWEPEHPILQSTEVKLLRTDAMVASVAQTISGDDWRDLEALDLEDEFLDRVLHGADAIQVAAELLTAYMGIPGYEAMLNRVSSDNGFDDYSVTGHPMVHRVTVGHGIRKGDTFNVYCADSHKVGGTWAGNLESSLVAIFQSLEHGH